MSLFCFLWMPLFYLFWHSISRKSSVDSGGIWALILGSIVAIIQFFLGSFINPGGFGFSRWVSACIDIVSLPAGFPFVVCIFFYYLRILSDSADFANFALLWLIPGAAIRAVSWSARNDPALLVITPLLWTAVALGIPFFIKLLWERPGRAFLPAALAIMALPLTAATAYWAFFSQKPVLGFLFFSITLIPMGISVISSYYRSCINR